MASPPPPRRPAVESMPKEEFIALWRDHEGHPHLPTDLHEQLYRMSGGPPPPPPIKFQLDRVPGSGQQLWFLAEGLAAQDWFRDKQEDGEQPTASDEVSYDGSWRYFEVRRRPWRILWSSVDPIPRVFYERAVCHRCLRLMPESALGRDFAARERGALMCVEDPTIAHLPHPFNDNRAVCQEIYEEILQRCIEEAKTSGKRRRWIELGRCCICGLYAPETRRFMQEWDEEAQRWKTDFSQPVCCLCAEHLPGVDVRDS